MQIILAENDPYCWSERFLLLAATAKGGRLLVITRFRAHNAEPDGPPWPLSDKELAQFQELGLQEIRRDSFGDTDNDSVKKLRVEYLRAYL